MNVINPILRQIQMDRESLYAYSRGKIPSFGDVYRRLFLLERQTNPFLPDHYYNGARDLALAGIGSIPQLLSAGMVRLSSAHLELRDHRIHVKTNASTNWQELLTFCTPLVCISALLWDNVFPCGCTNINDLASFMNEYIEPNVRYTCLPSTFAPHMENLIKNAGFCDLHIHLNGTTETEVAWQNFLRHPGAVSSEFEKAYLMKEKVREQVEQEEQGFEVTSIYRLLVTANRIRRGLTHFIFQGRDNSSLEELIAQVSTPHYLRSNSYVEWHMPFSSSHPMQEIFRTSPNDFDNWPDLCLETLFHILVMDQIYPAKNPDIAICYHYYLLILGFANRFIVQQAHQNGFDQFQKLTLNGFRETVEQSYENRFFQMHGNDLQNLSFLEGRFSPKSTPEDNRRLIKDIRKGWDLFRGRCESLKRPVPKFRLVAHFIKESDNKPLDRPVIAIRHRSLRNKLWKKANALIGTLRSPSMKRVITGIDAAANELETPPEVFAPIYRLLRRNGINHFTYHAGEDFHHLLGGLRAIYEAVEFLDLKAGDRIGHGTAAGIDPKLWCDRIGDRMYMTQGEHLDDLIFAFHMVNQHSISDKNDSLSTLRDEIERFGEIIYGQHFTPEVLRTAWEWRQFCPMHFLYPIEDAWDQEVWSADEWRLCSHADNASNAYKLLELYHTGNIRCRYNKMIEIPTTRIFDSDRLRIFQKEVLRHLHNKEIVLEVLPTSNVRISFYRDYSEHHIRRWLNLDNNDRTEDMPSIVIGSDDPGIFATNIRNEYSHIYHQVADISKSHDKAREVFERIIRNANTYRFE